MTQERLTRAQLASVTTYELPNFANFDWQVAEGGDLDRFIILLELGEAGELLAHELIELLALTDQSKNPQKISAEDWKPRQTNGLTEIAELEHFTIQESVYPNQLLIDIKDLGSAVLNRTHEGLIIDVYNSDQAATECVGTLAIEESDFQTDSDD